MRSLALALLGLLAPAGCDDGPRHAGNAPSAVLRAPATCDLGQSVILDASGSTDPDGDIVLYRFVIGDGSAAREQTEPRATHVCRTAGLIEAAVFVVDATGLTSRASSLIAVRRP